MPSSSKWADVLSPGQQPPEPPPHWSPSPEELDGLQPAGRAFLTRILDEFTIDLIQGLLMLEAAATVDSLVIWRAEAATNPKAARLAIAHTKTIAGLLQQAGLR